MVDLERQIRLMAIAKNWNEKKNTKFMFMSTYKFYFCLSFSAILTIKNIVQIYTKI